MRILILSQWFQPEPALKGLPFAKALMRRGHNVEVLTGFPNYPFGRIYPGYRLKLLQREKIADINIIRTYLYPNHSKNRIGRILNYLSFAISASIFGPFLLKKPDIIYVYHPPATILLPAIILKIFYRVPIILDIQDMWPDTLKSTDMIKSHLLIKIIGAICKLFYKFADRIVVLSPGFKDLLVKREVPKYKIEVIYNWCDEYSIKDSGNENDYKKNDNDKYFKVVYAGNMGMAQGLETIIEAADIIQHRSKKIKIILIGKGTEENKLKSLANELRLTNIEFLSFVPMNNVGRYLSEADILLVHLKKDSLFSITIPSKTQAYMAIGRPILMCVSGDASHLIEEAGAGICVEPQNPKALADAIIMLSEYSKNQLDKMGISAKSYYINNLSLEAGVNKFINLFLESIRS